MNVCLVYPVHISDEKFENCMDLLMITDKNSHTICISRVLTDLCVIRQKTKIKNTFASIAYNVLVVKKFW